MLDRIVIEGGLIRRERIETLSQAPLEALAPHLVRRIATTLPVLPSNPTKYMHFDGETKRGMLLVETAPALRHIRVQHTGRDSRYQPDAERRDDGNTGIWRVQFPWQYFCFRFRYNERGMTQVGFTLDDTALYWARETLRDENHHLIPAPVPNVSTNAIICWGSTRAENTSMSARIDDYINNFTTTTFNEDLGHFTPFGNSLTAWEEASANPDPFAWRNWEIWNDHPYATTPLQVSQSLEAQGLPPMAELNPSFIDLPTAPANFTVMRARQYLDSLSPAARQRFVAALTPDEPITEEATA